MLTTKGIVFRQTRFKESSLILDIFTEEAGLQSFIANSVYSKKGAGLASVFQLMNIVEVVAYFRDQKELHRISEAKLASVYQSIPFDIRRSAIGQFMLEVSRKSIRLKQAHAQLFEFLKTTYVDLDSSEQINPNIPILFLIELSGFLGFQPHNNYSEEDNSFDLANGVFRNYASHVPYLIDPVSSRIFSNLLTDFDYADQLQNASQRRTLLNYLLLFYQLHVEHFGQVKSIEVFRDIL